MARYKVTLYCEQYAVVEVDVEDLPSGAAEREQVLRDAALARLDESGGAEWESVEGWTDWDRVPDPAT